MNRIIDEADSYNKLYETFNDINNLWKESLIKYNISSYNENENININNTSEIKDFIVLNEKEMAEIYIVDKNFEKQDEDNIEIPDNLENNYVFINFKLIFI